MCEANVAVKAGYFIYGSFSDKYIYRSLCPIREIRAQNKMKSYLEGHPITRWGRAP